jgi:hypothetical protein
MSGSFNYFRKHPTGSHVNRRMRFGGDSVTSRDGAAALLLPEEKDTFQFVVFGDRTGGPP